ncbi:hypothetical protein ASPBRDRAFT_33507 [Aspergillus brasiliensis CBS 101740]|uniref:Protein kinase domain-containing protein n=1 Tax=Aspergillus brasiliensis (strain CBS 101740 / IMI 381727 / IBT 21946) TaxID=767769 RepID=A0A1L9U9C7_ASPBC|nr:hypothetical protein ASPBRDRAFT_33507 [Aspergillus brasiliensis CBS 101740]
MLDGSTVLKYPSIPGDREGIEVEAELLKILESHPRIIATKGLKEYGLVLQLPEYVEDGGTPLDGIARENTKSIMPRIHGDVANVKTNVFALGSAIYFIMMGLDLSQIETSENLGLTLRIRTKNRVNWTDCFIE